MLWQGGGQNINRRINKDIKKRGIAFYKPGQGQQKEHPAAHVLQVFVAGQVFL